MTESILPNIVLLNTGARPEFSASFGNFCKIVLVSAHTCPARIGRKAGGAVADLAAAMGVAPSRIIAAALEVLVERHKGLESDSVLASAPFRDLCLRETTGSRADSGVIRLRLEQEVDGAWSGEWSRDFDTEPSFGSLAEFAGRFDTLLEAVLAQPDSPVGLAPILSDAEAHKIIVAWNDCRQPFPSGASVPGLFRECALAHPGAVAMVDGDRQVTYGELEIQSNAWAYQMAARGAAAGTVVALALPRSADLFTAMLAVLKTGACYLPVDAASPEAWLRSVGADARPVLVITERAGSPSAEALCAPAFALDALASRSEATVFPISGVAATDPAYIIYTSGSTGAPKGVQVDHRGIVRLVRNTNYIQLGPGDAVAQIANATFDAITFEVWGALLNGGRVVVVPSETLLLPGELAAVIRSRRISVMFLTTALFNLVARLQPDAFAPLRVLLMGGEAATPAHQRAVLAAGRPAAMLHVYGPTECTTFSLWRPIAEVAPDATSIPIGRPLANMRAYVLDRQLQPVPPGVEGELFLGGEGLAIGYWNAPELTAAKFLQLPLAGGRVYRTGDRVRYLPDGEIEFLGRTDHQIKLRGFRIELGEIESALKMHPQIAEGVALLQTQMNGEKRIALYASAMAGARPSGSELREFLRSKLPEYMVPASIQLLDQLPLNSSGKIDRKANYPVAEEASMPVAGAAFPQNGIEARVAHVWEGILRRTGLGLDENFFDLGATSLDLAEAHGKIEASLGARIRVTDLFRYSTIRSLAAHLGAVAETAPASTGVREQALLDQAQAQAARRAAAMANRRNAIRTLAQSKQEKAEGEADDE